MNFFMDSLDENKTSIKKKHKDEKSRTLRNFRNLIIKIIILALIIYIIFGWIFGITKMKTSYMNPRIAEGDLILFYRLDKNYELQDAVVLNNNGKEYILRIVAKEGQTVDISENGDLLIDGFREEIPAFFKTQKDRNSQITFPYTVGPNQYFVMNDYRDSKDDSRNFGAIPADSIKGKIISRIQIRNI